MSSTQLLTAVIALNKDIGCETRCKYTRVVSDNA